MIITNCLKENCSMGLRLAIKEKELFLLRRQSSRLFYRAKERIKKEIIDLKEERGKLYTKQPVNSLAYSLPLVRVSSNVVKRVKVKETI